MISLNKSKNAVKDAREKKSSLTVVITGGSKGLGRSLAENYHKQDHKVITLSRNNVKTPWKHVKGDLTTKNTVLEAFDDIMLASNSHVDIWINNAAMSGGYHEFLSRDDKEVCDILFTNLVAPAVLCKKAYDVMIQQNTRGDIYNIAGAGSNGRGTPFFALYGSSKAGLKQFTTSLQKEWDKTGVHVHMLSPGMMTTPLLMNGLPDDVSNAIKPFTNKPSEVADVVCQEILDNYYNCEKNKYVNFWSLDRIVKKLFENITNSS